MKKTKFKYCFIFGEQRTGSTLIYRTIGSHPEITVSPNDFNLSRFCSGLRLDEIKQVNKLVEWNPEVLDNIKIKDKKCSKIISNVVNTYFNSLKSENNIFLHKTPKEEQNLETYRKAFKSKLNVIFVLRNPAGIIASRKRWPKDYNGVNLEIDNLNIDSYQEKLKEYKKIINRILESFRIIDQNFNSRDTIYTIRYEDFLEDPDFILKKIFDRLLISNCSWNNLEIENISENDTVSSYDRTRNFKSLDKSKVENWKYVLTETELRLLYNEMLEFYKTKQLTNTKMKIFFKDYLNQIAGFLD